MFRRRPLKLLFIISKNIVKTFGTLVEPKKFEITRQTWLNVFLRYLFTFQQFDTSLKNGIVALYNLNPINL